ncbi:MAG: hypothetical protein KGQ41_05980 [Alphaproteobacteria bacterium]|nr:hypothetical protein [Alphaproteobacteria bacterium]
MKAREKLSSVFSYVAWGFNGALGGAAAALAFGKAAAGAVIGGVVWLGLRAAASISYKRSVKKAKEEHGPTSRFPGYNPKG